MEPGRLLSRGRNVCLQLVIIATWLCVPLLGHTQSEAQGREEYEVQWEQKVAKPSEVPATILWNPALLQQPEGERGISPLDQRIQESLQPEQPNKLLPLMIFLLGLVLVGGWAALLAMTIISGGTLLLVLTIVLSPLMLLGIIFLIGAVSVALFGKKRKPEPPSTPPATGS